MNKTWAVGQDMGLLEISFGDLDLNKGLWFEKEDLIECGDGYFTLKVGALTATRAKLYEIMGTKEILRVVMQDEVIIHEQYILSGQSFLFNGDPMGIKFHFRRVG